MGSPRAPRALVAPPWRRRDLKRGGSVRLSLVSTPCRITGSDEAFRGVRPPGRRRAESLCRRPDDGPEVISAIRALASAMKPRSATTDRPREFDISKNIVLHVERVRVYNACMTDHKSRLPHVTRGLVRHDPHHVVLTVHDDVPPLHRREIRELWLSLQAEACRRYPGVTVSGGCAMPTHYHLILQASGQAADISRAIQFLASKLARGINLLAGRSGAVFRDRYFSRVLSTVSELVQALRYVGQNPVKALLVRRPEDWVASSVAECLSRTRRTGAWTYRGWMYRVLGFFEDAAGALARILSGEISVRKPGRCRQAKLPFVRGLPAVRPARG